MAAIKNCILNVHARRERPRSGDLERRLKITSRDDDDDVNSTMTLPSSNLTWVELKYRFSVSASLDGIMFLYVNT